MTPRVLRTLLLAVAFCLMSAARSQVVINEILADNDGAVPNASDFPDYAELANVTATDIDLGGWSLTDDVLVPRKFTFPAGVIIPAGGYLIVWCDSNFGSPGIHTGFGLSDSGELLRLYAPDSAVPTDSVSFGLQAPNLSIGRVPDVTGNWTLTRPTPAEANEAEEVADDPVLFINEWMARPATGEDWIEVFNPGDRPVSLAGMVLTDSTSPLPNNRPIPQLSFIGPRDYIQFFASDLESLDADHLDFRLSGDGETLTLYAPDKTTVIDRVTFGAQAQNVSEGRVPDGGENFATFSGPAITPGAPNVQAVLGVVINEILSHTDPPLEDAIELHNPTDEPVDISHWWLSDSVGQPRKYRIPAGTIIPPGGFAVFYEYQFGAGADGFALNSYEGDRVVLSAGDASGNLTGQQTQVSFGALRNAVSAGRVPTSIGFDFVPLSARTFGNDTPGSLGEFRLGTGRSNAPPRLSPLVINEIHFHPAGTNNPDEFLELHNPTSQPVSLFDPAAPTNTWRIRDGISFEFPYNVEVPPGGFVLLVEFDPEQEPDTLASFRGRFNVPAGVPILGPYRGSLSNGGEAIELLSPDKPEGPDSPDAGFVPYELQERIRYAPGAPWPTGASGTGRSLQRLDPSAYGNEPLNWFVSEPTPGRANQASAPLRIDRLTAAESGWVLAFEAAAGQAYAVEFAGDLTAPDWETVAEIPPGSAGPREVTVNTPAGATGFLRLVVPSANP